MVECLSMHMYSADGPSVINLINMQSRSVALLWCVLGQVKGWPKTDGIGSDGSRWNMTPPDAGVQTRRMMMMKKMMMMM